MEGLSKETFMQYLSLPGWLSSWQGNRCYLLHQDLQGVAICADFDMKAVVCLTLPADEKMVLAMLKLPSYQFSIIGLLDVELSAMTQAAKPRAVLSSPAELALEMVGLLENGLVKGVFHLTAGKLNFRTKKRQSYFVIAKSDEEKELLNVLLQLIEKSVSDVDKHRVRNLSYFHSGVANIWEISEIGEWREDLGFVWLTNYYPYDPSEIIKNKMAQNENVPCPICHKFFWVNYQAEADLCARVAHWMQKHGCIQPQRTLMAYDLDICELV